jgi:hypothetical protein
MMRRPDAEAAEHPGRSQCQLDTASDLGQQQDENLVADLSRCWTMLASGRWARRSSL